MNEQLVKIFELPTKTKIGILFGVVAVFGLGFWFVLYSPQQEELAKLEKSIEGPDGLRIKIQQKRGIAKNLNKYRKEVEQLDVELKKALLELPDKREISQLLSRVSEKARDSGLEIQIFKPQAEQKKDFYAEVPVEVEVSGTFHEVATFFDEVGRLERIVNLNQFSMSEPQMDDERVILRTSLVATSFRFLEEGERPQEDDTKTESKRRKKKKATKEE